MGMNVLHRWICGSARWARRAREQLLPWALAGVELGDDVLEVGPGYGATTAVLAERVDQLTVLEVDQALAARLRARLPGTVRVAEGDGAAMPLPDATFTAVLCFTMLHHMPSPARQDGLFAEAHRVLRPGGVLAGSDSIATPMFRLLHLADTMVPVDPAALPDRLAAAGFTGIRVDQAAGRSFRFRAEKPAG
ncbi:class I SAM-dependent methyltransferase [Gandjariella thermophila]|uniref:class I SAM-dependent methyltransferase n=1 Tax=Gandjariella thermophila TaxID=1931992 RepID=UPI0010F82C7F|nr:class I SAM-dependent methyltransferase [Gandjariella thermophila]